MVAAAGYAVGLVLRRSAPVGHRIVSPMAAAILADRGSPRQEAAGATLTLAVFSDYRCPACRHAFPALDAALRRDGMVSVVYKDWPIFGPASERAARIALASAEQGIYPAVHRRLMTDDRTIDDAMLRDVMTAAGGDWGRAMAWLDANAPEVRARLRRNAEQAYSIGLVGTPGYLAEPILQIGALDVDGFARLFEHSRAPV